MRYVMSLCSFYSWGNWALSNNLLKVVTDPKSNFSDQVLITISIVYVFWSFHVLGAMAEAKMCELLCLVLGGS